MDENGINVVMPETDGKTVREIALLLDNTTYGVPGMPRILTPEMIESAIQEGKIRVIENSAEKILVGLIITAFADESNGFGFFSLIFNQGLVKNRPEIITSAVKGFKEYYHRRNLSAISVVLVSPTSKTIADLMKNCGFEAETPSCAQLKKSDGLINTVWFSATSNGRTTSGVKTLVPQTETAKNLQNLHAELEAVTQELQETKNAKMLAEDNLAKANEEIAQKIEEIKRLEDFLAEKPEAGSAQEIRELNDKIVALEKEVAKETVQKKKFKEWLDDSKAREAEKDGVIVSLKAQVGELGGKPVETSKSIAPAVIPASEETDSPSQENQSSEPKINLGGITALQLENLIQGKLGEKNVSPNRPTIKEMAETIIFLHKNRDSDITIADLRNHLNRSEPTIKNRLEMLESIGLIAIEWRRISGKGQAKMVPKLIAAEIEFAAQTAGKTENKQDPPKEELPASPNKSKSDEEKEQVLKLVIKHPEGIRQQEIIRETGIQQTRTILAVRNLTEKGLTTNEPLGNQRIVKPVKEKIKELFPELLSEETADLPHEKKEEPSGQNKPEIVIEPEQKTSEPETGKNEPTEDKISNAEPVADDKKVIIVEGTELTPREKILNSILDDGQIEKGMNKILHAMDTEDAIKADVLGSHCKIKKTDMEAFVLLVLRNINREARKKNREPPIKSVAIHRSDDYEKTTIEINPEIDEPESRISGQICLNL